MGIINVFISFILDVGTLLNSGAESDVEKYKKSYEDALRTNDYGKMAYYTRLIQEAESKNK